MKNEELSNFLTAIGGIAEIAGVLSKELLNNGFTREEALYIVGNFVIDRFRPHPKTEGGDEA